MFYLKLSNLCCVYFAERQLYWTNGQAHSIESCDLSGNYHRVISLGIDSRPFGILLKGPHIYWTDHQSFNKLMQVDKATGSNVVAVSGLDLARPNGVYSRSTSASPGKNTWMRRIFLNWLFNILTFLPAVCII